jgi:gamma-glutamylcysteine synthetase
LRHERVLQLAEVAKEAAKKDEARVSAAQEEALKATANADYLSGEAAATQEEVAKRQLKLAQEGAKEMAKKAEEALKVVDDGVNSAPDNGEEETSSFRQVRSGNGQRTLQAV